MAKKRIQKIPKVASIKCPFCGKSSRVKLSLENSLQFLDCPKCEGKISTPITQCCLVCAFSDKKCPQALLMEAKIKGLEIR
jgi:Zn ribbon nucleic-acid-binding protein